MTKASGKWVPKKFGVVVGFLALAAVPTLGLSAFAAAADTSTTGTGTEGQPGARPPRAELTDAQKQCLADHGVTLPARPAPGTAGERPARPTDDQQAAFREAAEACGLPVPTGHGPGFAGPGGPGGPGGMRPALTDAQKQCLAGQGVTLPQRPADGPGGERPSPPTAEQRAAFQAAAAACGITIPAHGPREASAQGAAV